VVAAQSALAGTFDPGHARAVLERVEEAGLQGCRRWTGRCTRCAASRPAWGRHVLADLTELVDRFSATGGVRARLDVRPDVDGALTRPAPRGSR
jgi:hypothetical protein